MSGDLWQGEMRGGWPTTSISILIPNVAIFLKNVFIFKDRTLKKNNIERTRISSWFGRANEENVVRTRD